jgi:hypothetical protein
MDPASEDGWIANSNDYVQNVYMYVFYDIRINSEI